MKVYRDEYYGAIRHIVNNNPHFKGNSIEVQSVLDGLLSHKNWSNEGMTSIGTAGFEVHRYEEDPCFRILVWPHFNVDWEEIMEVD